MTFSQILTIEQVSVLLNLPKSWIYQRTCDGALRGTGRGRRGRWPGSSARPHPSDSVERMPHFKAGRLLRFDRDEVLTWFAKLHRGPEPSDNQPGDVFQRTENLSVTHPR